jgi:hypothetical protein
MQLCKNSRIRIFFVTFGLESNVDNLETIYYKYLNFMLAPALFREAERVMERMRSRERAAVEIEKIATEAEVRSVIHQC